MHFDIMFSSLFNLVTSPHLIGLMLLAVPIGTFFGMVPGLGGKLGVVMMIPFVYGMDTLSGCVFCSPCIPSSTPAGPFRASCSESPPTAPEAATIPDGFPLAEEGKAGRAIGATLTASDVGGVIGAFVLFLLLPVIEPIILAFSPAEFFMLALLGITFIAAVSGESMSTGLIVGLFGLMVLFFIGLDQQTGTARFTLRSVVSVGWRQSDYRDFRRVRRAGNARSRSHGRGRFQGEGAAADWPRRTFVQGVLDVFRHWFLTLRTAVMGTFIGMVPGLGGDAASWFCYGHAVQTLKTPERFGKGAIEGVIAPNTAANSKELGGLVPTLFFGVLGSSGMAILLGVFIMLGVQPGPTMIVKDLPLVWSLIWALGDRQRRVLGVVAVLRAMVRTCRIAAREPAGALRVHHGSAGMLSQQSALGEHAGADGRGRLRLSLEAVQLAARAVRHRPHSRLDRRAVVP